MKSPFLEPAAAAAAIPRGGAAFGRVRVPSGARGPRRVVGASLARPGRMTVLVAALQEPLDQRGREGAVAPAPEADGSAAASAEISASPAGIGKTVRVRFVLREQCTFGHSFHLVGDDLALGLWEPANAVALDWSEGHDWTVEKDLLVNRLVEFKFLLQDHLGNFHWQTGPNRSLETGETTKTLVVYEDWSDGKNQKVAEEGDASGEMVEAVVADDDKSINDVVLANELQADDDREIKEDESSIGDDENSMVAAITSVRGESVKACEADRQEKIQDELRDEVDAAQQDGNTATYAADDYGERTDDDSILSKDGVLVKNEWTRAFERELLWCWKALQQLLGFKMDTT